MSLSVSLGNALGALQVNQRSLEITSHNIANAQTDGYSRQTVNRETVILNGQGGGGVRSGSVTRTVDEFVVRELRSEVANLAATTVSDRYLGMTQDMFGSPASDSSLTARLADLAASVEALAVEPGSSTRRSAMIEAAATIAREINGMAGTVQNLRTEADRELASGVAGLNDELEKIASLNSLIVRETALGRSTSDLMDSRDRSVKAVAEMMDVQQYSRSSGELVLYTNGGRPLVDGTARRLEYTSAASASPTASFGDITIEGTAITGSIGAGKLGGLIEVRDSTLNGLQGQLDVLATKLRDEVNLVHNRGTAVPPPAVLSGTRTFADVSAERVTISDAVRVAVLDTAGIVQGYQDLPAGTYSVEDLASAINTNLGGFATATVADGAGFSLSANAGGNGVALVDLEASGGDTTVAYSADGATRQFRGLSNFLGLNDLFVTPGHVAGGSMTGAAQDLSVRSDIVADPARVAGARLTGAASPVAGTGVGVSLGDTATLDQLASAFDRQLGFPTAGSLVVRNGTLSEYASEILGRNSQNAATASDSLMLQTAIVDDLGYKASSVSGVNLDEEMANLVVYQNAYAASARLVSVISDMYEILTGMA